MQRYHRRRVEGHTFIFKYDDVDSSQLHIFVRHLCTPETAVDTFFDATETRYCDLYRRFESSTDSHAVYWFWRDEDSKVVMIITCFRRD